MGYRTLERMKELENDLQKLGEFFEWLQSKYCILIEQQKMN